MSWSFQPKYQLKHNKTTSSKKKSDNLWNKCPECHHITYLEDYHRTYKVCIKCHFHDRITALERINLLLDPNSFEETHKQLLAKDILEFFDGELSYENKLKKNRQLKFLNDAVITGKGLLHNTAINIAVMDFSFMGGSMGAVVGEKITRVIENGTKESTPVIIVCASGGARMQEGILSLMQMAKTASAIKKHSDAGLLYITILTNPTTGGVTASFAMLGDFIIAEPKALIGFAGPRVITQTMQQKLPDGFQRSEFLQEHGFVDMICSRSNLKSLLSKIIYYAGSE